MYFAFWHSSVFIISLFKKYVNQLYIIKVCSKIASRVSSSGRFFWVSQISLENELARFRALADSQLSSGRQFSHWTASMDLFSQAFRARWECTDPRTHREKGSRRQLWSWYYLFRLLQLLSWYRTGIRLRIRAWTWSSAFVSRGSYWWTRRVYDQLGPLVLEYIRQFFAWGQWCTAWECRSPAPHLWAASIAPEKSYLPCKLSLQVQGCSQLHFTARQQACPEQLGSLSHAEGTLQAASPHPFSCIAPLQAKWSYSWEQVFAFHKFRW